MIKIREHQHEKGVPSNNQERIIDYPSWEEYIEDIQNVGGSVKRNPYLSIPRQTKPKEFQLFGDWLKFEFEHPIFRRIIIHKATLIEEGKE